MTAVHISPFAGAWYPERPSELDELLDQLFENSHRRTGQHVIPKVLALVVPHAAPFYSGTVAAAAYRHLRLQAPDRIFLLGFHHHALPHFIAVPDLNEYRTPLGRTVVDRNAARTLCSSEPFQLVAEAGACDHSVEIQLPFLRRAAPRAAVVPLYVGRLTEEQSTRAAEAITRTLQPGDVLLASSDLTHYGPDFCYVPFPVDEQTAARLKALDESIISAASSVDGNLFLEIVGTSGSTACGQDPIALLLRTLSCLGAGDIFQQTLDYQTSGEINGDFCNSVSYGALGYFWQSSFEVDKTAQQELLASASATLCHLRKTGRAEAVSPRELPSLTRRAPVFVSIHTAGQLTGCVGRAFECQPLSGAVPQLTLSAAIDDPRCHAADGLAGDTEIEISVLTPMKLVRGPEALQIGLDGGYLKCGPHGAILLPQAAPPGWSAARFVQHLFQKACLPPQTDSLPLPRLHTFRTQIFSRRDSLNSAKSVALNDSTKHM